jgi:hypothetical protein
MKVFFKNILKLRVILIIFILLFFLTLLLFLKDNNYNKVPEFDNKSKEIIISPNKNIENYEINLNEKLHKSTLQKIQIIENLFINWQDVLDIFTFNRSTIFSLNPDTGIVGVNISRKIYNFSKSPNVNNTEQIVKDYGDVIKKECNFYKIDWRLILAIIEQESAFNPNAVSRAGAFGLMQIMPKTGSSLQSQLNLEDYKTPQNNLIAGIYYFATLVSAFEFTKEEKYKFALASYNAGLGRVIDAMTIANYFEKDYKLWDNVKECLPLLSSNQDSIQSLVWPSNRKPSYGTLNNWKEPYLYVEKIVYLYSEYKKIFAPNLKEENKLNKKKKKIDGKRK